MRRMVEKRKNIVRKIHGVKRKAELFGSATRGSVIKKRRSKNHAFDMHARRAKDAHGKHGIEATGKEGKGAGLREGGGVLCHF